MFFFVCVCALSFKIYLVKYAIQKFVKLTILHAFKVEPFFPQKMVFELCGQNTTCQQHLTSFWCQKSFFSFFFLKIAGSGSLTNRSFLNPSICFSRKHSSLTRNFDHPNKLWHQSDVIAWYSWINSTHSPDHFGGQNAQN